MLLKHGLRAHCRMREFILAYPGQLHTKTGGYYYLSRILQELPKIGWSGQPLSLGDGFPNPSQEVLSNAEKLIDSCQSKIPILADCLAWGVMDQCALQLAESHRIIPLVHHPLCLETGLPEAESKILFKKEQTVLTNSQKIITTSTDTSNCIQELFQIPKSKIIVALPGTDTAKPAISRDDGKVGLISVGSVVPRKGYDRLIKCLKSLENLSWHLEIVGDLTLAADYANSVTKKVAELELSHRINFHGSLEKSELEKIYSKSDIFVLATLYEGYGMAFTEAMIRGIPIVTTGEGAVNSTVSEVAGIVIENSDLTKFSSTLSTLITNPSLRKKYREGALKAGKNLPTWENTAEKIGDVLNLF